MGQRRGLGIAAPEPLYVLAVDAARREVVVGPQAALLRDRVFTGPLAWIGTDTPAPGEELAVVARLRSSHPGAPARLERAADGTAVVTLEEPEAATAPGQACVLYEGERVLGGGWITGTGQSATLAAVSCAAAPPPTAPRGGRLSAGRAYVSGSFGHRPVSPGSSIPRRAVSEPRLISESTALASLCAAWREATFITVDTEFMRESTYRAKLCLVQVGPPEGEPVAVDPLADGIDLAPLYDLLVRAPVLKVFHAARQDVEVLLSLAGGVPHPLFDTQIAAMVCGFGDSVGYETLVAKLARGRIDKTQRFTDWARRPLTERQLRYALSDVSHLRVVYEKLAAELERTGRRSWLDEELAVITDRATYEAPPEEAWRRLKVRGGNRRFLAILRELAAWREVEADRRDKPRAWVLRDTALSEVAAQRPRTVGELAKLRSVSQRTAESATGARPARCGQARSGAPRRAMPEPAGHRNEKSSAPAALTDLLKVLLTFKSEETGVARKLIASADDLERIARGEMSGVPALQGWRRALFGDAALDLVKRPARALCRARHAAPAHLRQRQRRRPRAERPLSLSLRWRGRERAPPRGSTRRG